MSSIPQTYTIADFIEWNGKHQLKLDPDFQRGSVWTPTAKIFLIDTILNDFPIPQIYFRTKIDVSKQTSIREVVDGQQRLRAILEFASGKLRLTGKSPRFRGHSYDSLDPYDQERFLSYKISTVQLINASNADVLEVFARLNSYSVKVTPAELRHAEYSEPIKWAVYHASREWKTLWDDYKVVSTRDAVRLKNNSVVAEMFIFLDQGVGDGGEPSINKYYRDNKEQDESHFAVLRERIDEIVNEMLNEVGDDLKCTALFDSPNFLMLFAAVAYLKGYATKGRVLTELALGGPRPINWNAAKYHLANIAQSFDQTNEDEDGPYSSFVSATKSSTHRIASRKIRLMYLVNALTDDAT